MSNRFSQWRPGATAGLLWAVGLVSVAGICRAEDSTSTWPNWRGPGGQARWAAPPLAESWPDDGLTVRWESPLGAAYSGISVAHDRVFTMDRQGNQERVVCLDARDGQPIWTWTYRADYGDLDYGKGPRATPTLHAGLVYACGAVGQLHCLDAETGELKWSKDLIRDFGARQPTWGFAASPVIHGDKLIVHAGGEGGGCYVALDRRTGQEVWRGGDDPAGYCTPILIRHAGVEQLIGWTPEHVISLSPTDGTLNWQVPYEVTMGVAIATPIFHEGTVLVSGYWEGAKAIKLGDAVPDATLLWEENRFLRGLMAQPLYREGFAYLLDKQHGVVCFELSTGKIRWRDEKHELTPRSRNPQLTLVWVGDSDRAMCLNSDGQLMQIRLSPTGFTELARASIIGETWAHPAYVGSRVYARDDKRLVCIELPGR